MLLGRVRRDDAGQVATALVVCAVLGAVVLLVAVLLPLAGASDQRSRAQTAADAAALAYVDSLGKHVRQKLTAPLFHGGGKLHPLVGCGVGRANAEDYANRNGARLDTEPALGACGKRDRTTVTLEVVMLDALPSGQRARARAAARMGFPTGECDLSPSPSQVIADFEAAQAAQAAAKAAAEAAQDAAQEAAADAAQAFKEFVNAPPEEKGELAEAAEQAKEAAEEAAEKAAKAVDDVAAEVEADPVPITADCGPVSLRLVLQLLPSPSLEFEAVEGGDLDELLEPRLVSTRGFGL
jgi:hypothetical protein